MSEELESSTYDLQKKFQEWFEDTIPVNPPFPIETDCSIGTPASADPLPPVKIYPSKYESRTTRYDLQKLSDLISFGFNGSIFLGTGVGFIILVINISLFDWYGIQWPDQFFVIFLAMVIGFWGGLFKGSIDKLHEKYSYKTGYKLSLKKFDTRSFQ